MALLQNLARTWPLPRDKADTLLLLATCALVLVPHAGQVPAWTLPVCALMLGWRGWITWNGTRMPPRLLLMFLAVALVIGVYASYRTIVGRQAGVTMLALLLTLKLLEMHARRDLFVVLYLSIFLLLANFFHTQSIGAAVYTAGVMLLLTTTQLSFQYTGLVPPLRRRLATAATILGLATPLMLVLFLLVPRIQGPLWGLPHDAAAGRTGMSDTMAPGNIASLAQSEEIAFRARFPGAPPERDKLYWRGIVLGQFDGRTWSALPPQYWRGPVQLRARGAPLTYEVTIEPSGKPWLFALDLASAPASIPGTPTRLTADLEMLAYQPISGRLRYEPSSHLDADLQPELPERVQRNWLHLPGGYNPRARAMAAQLREQHQDPARIAGAMLRHFGHENFVYTLEPPLLGRDTVDEFLFSTRAGFCEHYSSAFVFMMRAAGVPARVVLGYQGGTLNPVDGYLVVRQSDAHAWAEIWLPGKGWTRVDPTAAVAPDRVRSSLASVLPNRALGGLITLDVAGNSLLAALRHNWDAVTNSWNQWVLNYSSEKQFGLLRAIGFAEPDWRTLMAVLGVAGSLVFAIIAWPLLRNRQRLDPVDACYRAMCALLARQGMARLPYEGPRAFGERLAAAGSPLDDGRRAAARQFMHLYERARYADVDKSGRAAALSEMKALLSACR